MINEAVFFSLFKEACNKCFGNPLTTPLTETDSKILSNTILEKTGLVIGPKSIKNYSLYIVSPAVNQKENPSDATLDTLARYVLDAPHTDEINRKKNESHFPYWFRYRNSFPASDAIPPNLKKAKPKRNLVLLITSLLIIVIIPVIIFLPKKNHPDHYTEDFNSNSEDSLTKHGWSIKSLDSSWWSKRNEKPGHLALFTLRGDNWKNEENEAHISNLILRRIQSECFTVEIHLTNFMPRQNWQQAGMLLSEDSSFTGKMVRLSISYNDFFGGYKKPPEIIIQAVSSAESGNLSKPEEIAHFVLFNIEADQWNLVEKNLAASALKIEKSGYHFRFLYTAGPMESFAFKEITNKEISIQPRFIGLFAIQGWTEGSGNLPAYFDSYLFSSIPCIK
jgi:hypothetical protein